jgi:hypothetical protein
MNLYGYSSGPAAQRGEVCIGCIQHESLASVARYCWRLSGARRCWVAERGSTVWHEVDSKGRLLSCVAEMLELAKTLETAENGDIAPKLP